jgi:predicted nucleic acid-binding protein
VDAAALAQRLDHPVYDCLDAVLAKRENSRLVTADLRFAAKLTNDVVDVETIGT